MYYMDYHIHSKFSFDSVEELDLICQQAIHAGLSEIALTDHLDLHYGDDMSDCHYLRHEPDRESAVRKARETYAGKLTLRYGLELGQPSRNRDFLKTFKANRNFDFVLGSIHYTTDEREILALTYPDHETADRVIREYFDNVYHLLDDDDFDVIAHICHPLRVMDRAFDKPSFLEYTDLIYPILRRIAEKGKGLEVSTKGLRYWIRALEPEIPILKKYREFGGEFITVGTDSHEACTVGSGVREAYDYIAQAGFRYITSYENHQPTQHPLKV